MTDESKSMHDTTNPREARPQDGGNSGGRQGKPNEAKPTHGDPDRRSIGDESQRGRQETQSAGARGGSNDDRSSDDRSKSGQQSGQQQGKQSGSGLGSNEPRQGGAGGNPSSREGQSMRGDSQGDRQAK